MNLSIIIDYYQTQSISRIERNFRLIIDYNRSASDFFQEWWAQVAHGAKNGGSFSEMMGPNI